ncbi:hypothetical protein EE612_059535 [Oryza sativa]|nr:hypothetical protein EE612_059535 [Oryza sativa]
MDPAGGGARSRPVSASPSLSRGVRAAIASPAAAK